MTGSPTDVAVIDGVDLDAVAAAVRACPAVDDLDGDAREASVTTYLPGRRLSGLRLADEALTVSVRSWWGVPVRQVAAEIQLAVGPLVGGRVVDVVVADLTPAPGHEPPVPLEPMLPAAGPPRPEPLVPAVVDPALPATPRPASVVRPLPGGTGIPDRMDVRRSEVADLWMPSNAGGDAPSSAPTIPTAGETPRSS